MHIVQIANFVSPTSGGIGTALRALGERYSLEGHQVTLITPGPAESIVQQAFVREVVVRGPRLPGSGGYRVILDRRRITELLRDLRPDVVELSDRSTLAWLPAWLGEQGIPCVMISHERMDATLRLRGHGLLPARMLADTWNRRLADGAGAIVCASDFAAEEFVRIGASNVRRVSLGVDLATFTPLAADRPRRHRPSIVCVSRLSAEKHPDLAVRTAQVLARSGTHVDLIMFGAGPQLNRLRRLAELTSVDFVGHVSDRNELALALASADVVIAPGPAETFGLAALEAQAAGTPIVVPRTGALHELLSGGPRAAGIAAEATPESFASAVQTLLDADRSIQRRASRHNAERFSWEHAATGMLEVFEGVLGRVGDGSRGSRRSGRGQAYSAPVGRAYGSGRRQASVGSTRTSLGAEDSATPGAHRFLP